VAEPRRSPAPSFQPRFTLSLFYLALFFLLYCLLLVAPELAPLVEPAAPEQQAAIEEAAQQVARDAVAPRLPLALLLALATLFLASRARVLPGLRR
jgi:hypothetical protein